MKRRLSVTNFSSENNLPTFRMNAPVIIRVKVKTTNEEKGDLHHEPCGADYPLPHALNVSPSRRTWRQVLVMTTGAFSRNIGKLFSELKLVTDDLSSYMWLKLGYSCVCWCWIPAILSWVDNLLTIRIRVLVTARPIMSTHCRGYALLFCPLYRQLRQTRVMSGLQRRTENRLLFSDCKLLRGWPWLILCRHVGEGLVCITCNVMQTDPPHVLNRHPRRTCRRCWFCRWRPCSVFP